MSYVIANWKANHHLHSALTFLDELRAASNLHLKPTSVQAVICPPTALYFSLYHDEYITDTHESIFQLGLQDVSACEPGAHTGENVLETFYHYLPRFCIIGHSERRRDQGETPSLIAAKFAKLQKYHVTPILCFDEPEVDALVASLQPFQDKTFPLILAYEPVSAISTSGNAGNLDPVSVKAALDRTRKAFAHFHTDNWSFIYGGSVTSDNAGSYRDVCDGLLVGSASLKASSFHAICCAFGGAPYDD